MWRAVAALAACASLAFAGPAAADVRHASLGDVSARLSLSSRAGGYGELRPSVTRAGAVVYSGAVTTASGRPGSLERTPPVRRFLDVRLRVLDLDGDGSGETVIDLAEPGAYCCSHTVIVGATADGAYWPLELAAIDLRGLLTAIAGDRLLLGQGGRAARSLRDDVAAGRV
jgi:hypothetical protein